jgi:hypothetical protein
MTDFKTRQNQFDAAFCTVDTFRHLLSEKAAQQHLIHVAKSLKNGGIYILGLHLLPEQGVTNSVARWVSKRGRLTVNTTMTMLKLDKNKRTEKLKVVLTPKSKLKQESYTSVYPLRTYSLKQLNKMLDEVGVFNVAAVYNHEYDINNPVKLNSRSDYAVLVLQKMA